MREPICSSCSLNKSGMVKLMGFFHMSKPTSETYGKLLQNILTEPFSRLDIPDHQSRQQNFAKRAAPGLPFISTKPVQYISVCQKSASLAGYDAYGSKSIGQSSLEIFRMC